MAQTGEQHHTKAIGSAFSHFTNTPRVKDQDYKNSIQAVAAAYSQWYDEWREVCDIFQSLEERRLHYLRSSLWA